VNTVVVAVLAVIGLVVTIAGVGLLMAFPIMWCWNYTLPVLFGIKCITWGQAWCLHFLAGMLIKSTLTSSK
jgi:hypothetical protein